MASLMKKLFDTMPLAGVEGALRIANGNLRDSTVGQLARHLAYIETLSAFSVTSARPSRKVLAALDEQWNQIPIWGYDVPADPTCVKRITCRVRDDNFNNYVVLEHLEWGYAPVEDPTSFRDAVQIVFDNTEIDLPLSEEFRLMTFSTQGGQTGAGLHWLWPLDAQHDPSLLHVFAYDLHRSTKGLLSLKSADHPEREQINELLNRCRSLESTDPDNDENAWDFLFKDNLWDTSFMAEAPAGTVPESVDLSLKPVRILVACSLTVCTENDDFQPGRPMGTSRLYPHVMVVATSALQRVNAAVRFLRPTATARLDGTHCSCDEMADDPQIGGLLVTDSNADGMVLGDAGQPFVYLANLFNYYVPDPFLDPAFQNKALPVVRRSRTLNRSDVGAVNRACPDITDAAGAHNTENNFKVAKFRAQGMFDNLHLAPKMTVKDKIDRALIEGGVHEVKFTTAAAWKMDIVTMAPFCAHDCFHMHWRWSDNDSGEPGAWGWSQNTPHNEPGRVMVPDNQDVFLALTGLASVNYIAVAEGAAVDQWQVFCHHGSGYGLSAGKKVRLAKISMRAFDDVEFLVDAPGMRPVEVEGNWSLFYWRLRYRFKKIKKIDSTGKTFFEFEVEERFSFNDRARALDL
jgi:hypothetical protein